MADTLDGLTIKTDNKDRDVVDAWELTDAERAEFDYLDWQAIERGEDSRTFVRAFGNVYDLHDTEGRPSSPHLSDWDLFLSDSFFSGVVFRWVRTGETTRDGDAEIDFERVIVGRFYS